VVNGESDPPFKVTSGSLPGGLTLTETTGAITGKPTAAGTSSFTVEVKDSTGRTAGTTTTNCSIVISYPPIGLICPTNRMGQVGVYFSAQMQASHGDGDYTFSLSSGALPDRLADPPRRDPGLEGRDSRSVSR
jgi:hypothetical protein